MLPLPDQKRLEIVGRNHGIRAKNGEAIAKLLTAFLRKADEGTLGELIVEIAILLSTRTPEHGANILRTASQVYKVDTDAIARKVKQEFTAKDMKKPAAKTAAKRVA